VKPLRPSFATTLPLAALVLVSSSGALAAEPATPAEPLPTLPAPSEPPRGLFDAAALPPPEGPPAPAEPPATPPKRPPASRWTWDLNLEGALGKRFLDDEGLGGFGRVRAGLLHIDESELSSPRLSALGLTYELSDFRPATFGLQGEFLSVGAGLWAQLGAMIDTQPRPGFMGAVGWSLFGAEAQVRWEEDHGAVFGVYGKLRVPISVIVYALEDP
jgi:hypothetical protein